MTEPADINGYVAAFYELADMLGIPAQASSPRLVWETQMRPLLRERLGLAVATPSTDDRAGSSTGDDRHG